MIKIYNEVVINMDGGQVLSETSYEYSGPVAECKGAGKSGYPQPTAEEKAIQAIQLETLEQSKADTESLRPFLLKSMGLTEGDDGVPRKMTTEERTAGMTEMERGQYDLTRTGQQRLADAYSGEYRSSAMEERLAARREQLSEILASKLGANWGATTSGQQAMAALDKNVEILRDMATQNVISGESGLLRSNLGYLSGAGQQQAAGWTGLPGATSGMLSGYADMSAQMAQNRARQGQYMQQQATAASNRAAISSGGYGALAGSLIGAGGAYVGLIQKNRADDIWYGR